MPLVEDLNAGQMVMIPVRSGGAFDPIGPRAVDVVRAADVVDLVDSHPGRWVMITLSLDRRLWTCPEAAYQRAADRVREVARVVSRERIHVTALELQGKTGAGWPHWHLIVWCPDDRSIEEIDARVRRAWCITTEHVDEETGEVTRSREPLAGPKGIKVEQAVDRGGVARYCSKYIVKAWEAVPDWMGESRRQIRKLRPSSGFYDWLESSGRHVRHRGGRVRPSSPGSRGRARCLFDRMARSGCQHGVYRKRAGSLEFVGVVPVPACHEGGRLLDEVGAVPLRAGDWGRMRWTISERALWRLRSRETEARELQSREIAYRREVAASAWDEMQRRRSASRDELAES